MPVNYEFGHKLREARDSRRLGPEHVAGSRMPVTKYLSIETSNYIPDFDEAESLVVKGLGIEKGSPEYLDILQARTRDREKARDDPRMRHKILTFGVVDYSVDKDGNLTHHIGLVPRDSNYQRG